MKAVKNLKIFLEKINRNQFEPTVEAIDKLGDELAEAAHFLEGYAELIWQAGTYLLLVSEDEKEFYDRFGYPAVANALRASIEAGNFPLGLGFISYGFLPQGGLETLLHHPGIQQALLILQNTNVKLSPQSFRDTPNAIKNSNQFLNYAQALNVPMHVCLQIAAILVLVATNEQDREQATRALLNLLASNEKATSLFYCWRAACEKYPALWRERAYINSLLTMLKSCRNLNDQGAAILSQLHADQELLSAVIDDPHLFYLMGLSGWWLYVRYNRTGGLNTAWQLIWSIMNTYPKLCEALKSYLENEGPRGQSPEEIEWLQKDFQKEMSILREEIRSRISSHILREEIRLHIYRGVPRALQIQRHNLVCIFEPLYEALEGSSALPSTIHTTIYELDASELLDNNPLQKEALQHVQIIGELRSNMIKDYETIIASFRRALELREKLSKGSTEIASTLPLTTPDIQQEITAIQHDEPELCWIFEWFLPETLQPMSSTRPA